MLKYHERISNAQDGVRPLQGQDLVKGDSFSDTFDTVHDWKVPPHVPCDESKVSTCDPLCKLFGFSWLLTFRRLEYILR